MKGAGHRGRMRDHAVQLYAMLLKRKTVAIAEIMEELGISEDTVRRWIDSFSFIMQIRVENGIVRVDRGRFEMHLEREERGEWMEPWILTYSGKQFWPLDPRRDDVDIIDIAHSLSNACRFGGHSRQFYSVAEHSVLVVKAINNDGGPAPLTMQLTALLHDAAEAYLADIPSPIKPHLRGFREMEHRILRVILEHFGGYFPLPSEIKEADLAVLHAERHQIMNGGPPWSTENLPFPAAAIQIECWDPQTAERQFLDRFAMLAIR